MDDIEAKSLRSHSLFGDADSFFDRHPLSSPQISLEDRPKLSDTDSIQDLNEVYEKYLNGLNNPGAFKQKEIQASFESYIKSASRMVKEPELMALPPNHVHIHAPEPDCPQESECPLAKRSEHDTVSQSNNSLQKMADANAKRIVQRYKFSCLNSIKETDQRMLQGELKSESYASYIVLDKIWASEYIKKRDVKALQPCKVLLLRSIVKRKFDEELALQWPNKRPVGDQKPPERVAVQDGRETGRGVQQIPAEALF